jgi:hypothetical protein
MPLGDLQHKMQQVQPVDTEVVLTKATKELTAVAQRLQLSAREQARMAEELQVARQVRPYLSFAFSEISLVLHIASHGQCHMIVDLLCRQCCGRRQKKLSTQCAPSVAWWSSQRPLRPRMGRCRSIRCILACLCACHDAKN